VQISQSSLELNPEKEVSCFLFKNKSYKCKMISVYMITSSFILVSFSSIIYGALTIGTFREGLVEKTKN
jgi:hypothetical protein